jgi:hypothetical protein
MGVGISIWASFRIRMHRGSKSKAAKGISGSYLQVGKLVHTIGANLSGIGQIRNAGTAFR